MPHNIVVSAIQMNCTLYDKEANLQHAEDLIKEASLRGSKIVVLPELFNTGYRTEDKDKELAEIIPGDTTEWMVKKSAEYNTYITGTIIEKTESGELFDTAVLTGPEGYIGKQQKMHLWGSEPERFSNGSTLNTFKLPFSVIGILSCYEIGFPEQSRVMTLDGANILIFTSAFGKARAHVWDIASRSRAVENGSYVIACNRTGSERDTVFGGLSRIVAPDGSVIAGCTPDVEAVVTATIDLEAVEKQRMAVPYLRDLNHKLYINKF